MLIIALDANHAITVTNALRCNKGTVVLLDKQGKQSTKSTGMVFIDLDSRWRKRKIKEAIFIDCLNLNFEISSNSKKKNLEKGIEISNCWKEVNGEIRKILLKTPEIFTHER